MTAEIPELKRVSFASRFQKPLLTGEKTATIRLGRKGIEPGDHLVLHTDDGLELAYAEAEHVVEATPEMMQTALETLEAKHSVTKGEKSVREAVSPHYDEEIGAATLLTGLVFDVTRPLAAMPRYE